MAENCPHYGICGGCKLYNLSYLEQLSCKTDTVNRQLKKCEIPILPIIPSPIQYHYRNKVEFTFFTTEQKRAGLGFHKKGCFDDLVDLENCLLTPSSNIELIKTVRDWANQNRLTAYNKTKHTGLLRYLVIRDSFEQQQKLVILVTSGGNKDMFAELVDELKKNPDIAGFIWSDQPEDADAVLLKNWEIMYGDSFLMDQIGHVQYKIPFNSFFQVNVQAAKILYDLVLEKIQPDSTVLDLFCGAGTISAYLAGTAKSVTGIEVVENAIISARENARLNRLFNAEFITGKVREQLSRMEGKATFDAVILDPPRSGTDKKVMARIASLRPRDVIYVACGFENLAYNLKSLTSEGYHINSVQPLDMFPQTPHVEVVVHVTKG